MSAAQHTPAPWQVAQGGTGDNPTWNVRIGSSLVHLPGAFDMAVMDANANLIAAAPDLLEACREALRDLISDGHSHYRVADQLRDVIAKATGDAS